MLIIPWDVDARHVQCAKRSIKNTGGGKKTMKTGKCMMCNSNIYILNCNYQCQNCGYLMD